MSSSISDSKSIRNSRWYSLTDCINSPENIIPLSSYHFIACIIANDIKTISHQMHFGAREFSSCTINLCISWVFARFNLFISALVKIYSCYLQNSIWFVWKDAEMFLICKLKLWICRHQVVLFQSNMLKCNIILSDFVLIFQLFFFIIARLVVLCYLTMFNIIHLTILNTQVRSNNFAMSFIWWQIFVYRALIVLFSHF